MQGYAEILKRRRVSARVLGAEPMFDVVFADREMKDYRSAKGDEAMLRRLNALLRERGILKSESKHYISLAHTPEDVAVTLEAFDAAMAALLQAPAARSA
jgi:glutamate-1-semialdehyde 2,1-aminomutase